MWTTKKKLRKQIAELLEQIKDVTLLYNDANATIAEREDMLNDMFKKYPFEIGQVVYDVQLRSSKGRFTKTKASREHSYINEVVVDKKNYFNLVDRLAENDVFTNKPAAEAFIADVCVE